MKTHKDLQVWQDAVELVINIYKITENFPKGELYGLTNQIRRAAVSIPSNIAEGCGRNSAKELNCFLYYALGSLSELETQIIIALKLNYIKEEDEKTLLDKEMKNLFRLLTALIKSIKPK